MCVAVFEDRSVWSTPRQYLMVDSTMYFHGQMDSRRILDKFKLGAKRKQSTVKSTGIMGV